MEVLTARPDRLPCNPCPFPASLLLSSLDRGPLLATQLTRVLGASGGRGAERAGTPAFGVTLCYVYKHLVEALQIVRARARLCVYVCVCVCVCVCVVYLGQPVPHCS